MYYRMRYDTPDASDLARAVAALMPDSEPLHEHAHAAGSTTAPGCR